jgi:serine/threonine-protein kinase HipA
MVDVLHVRLGERVVGAITALGGDRSIFIFDDAYVEDPQRPTLSLSFKSAAGGLIRELNSTQTRLLPFFSNLLPEGPLRDYLAERAGVKPSREFYLLWALGADLPGSVTVATADGLSLPPAADADDQEPAPRRNRTVLRFSLAGVQLKFSAVEKATGGLTVPARGVGGDWIVKLPSTRFAGVSENEFSIMSLARLTGIDVPEIRLLSLDEIADLPEGVGRLNGTAYAIKRFDRLETGERLHIEDFAQVFGVYPENKYGRASYRNIAQVIWREIGEPGLVEFIRRLVFTFLVGNADMHLKNWSLLYRDGLNANLAPAYDFVATTAYLPDEKAALKVVRSKAWVDLDEGELRDLAARAGLPEVVVMQTAAETVMRFREAWERERGHLPVAPEVTEAVEHQLKIVPLANL